VLTLMRRLNAGLPSGCCINIDRPFFSFFSFFFLVDVFSVMYSSTSSSSRVGVGSSPASLFFHIFSQLWCLVCSFIAVLVFYAVEKATK
jgi:hypothetical protein